MQASNKMAVAPVGKLIWQMSIPPLISMFLQYSYKPDRQRVCSVAE